MEKEESVKKEEVKEKWSFREAFLRMDRQQWIVILLLGVLLAVISMPVGNNGFFKQATQTQEDKKSSIQAQKTGADSIFSFDGATSDVADTSGTVLEQKLEALLSGVEGIGKTQVLLMTQESAGEDFYGKASEKVTGVLISAQGADDPDTIQKIKDAMIALFQIEAHKIKVMKMK